MISNAQYYDKAMTTLYYFSASEDYLISVEEKIL